MSLKTNAALYEKAVAYLREWGWGKYIELVSGWKTRTNSSTIMTPTQVTIHHTGGARTPTSYLLHAADRPKLKNLANIHIDPVVRRIKILAAGGASHAGYTHQACFDRIQSGTAPLDRDLVPGADSKTFSPNKRAVGIEVNGAGGKSEWDEWTYRATVATAAAFDKAAGWTKKGQSPRVGAHKEHTHRKPGDPYAPMGAFRRDVLACLAAPWGPKGEAAPQEPAKFGTVVLSKDGVDSGPHVAELAKWLTTHGYDVGSPADVFGPKMKAAVEKVQADHGLKVDGVVGPETFAVILGPEKPVEPQPEDPDPEVPAPDPTKSRAFRLLQANTLNDQRFPNRVGVANNSPKWPEWLAKQRPSIMLLCETDPTRRDTIIAAKYFRNWTYWAEGMVSVWWNKTKWQHTKTGQWTPTKTGIHGASRATLRDTEGSGLEMDVISVHIRPNDAFAASWSKDRKAQAKRDELADLLADLLRPGIATWVGGDFSTSTYAAVLEKLGFKRATPAEATYGTSKLDAVWFRPGKTVECVARDQTLLNPGTLSDHRSWLVNGTIRAIPTN